MTVSIDLNALGENVRLKPAYDVSFDDLADLFTRSYSNYFVPMKMSADMLSWIVNTQTIDLAASQVIEVDGKNIAFIFISARGLSQRVAAMGVIPEFRGRKLGQFLVEDSIQRAREVGVHRMVLEVIDKNEYAISIYRKLGFEISRRLVGYHRPADTNPVETADEPHEIDPREVAKSLIHEGPRGLPWQIAPEVLFALRPPARAFTLERSAYAVLAGITDTTVRLDTILVPRAKRRKGWGSRMLKALFKLYPGREWVVTAVLPEDLTPEFYLANGFERQDIRQYEMVLKLDETSSRFPYQA